MGESPGDVRELRTGDLALATTLRCEGWEHVKMELNGRQAVWVFEGNGVLHALAEQYAAGTLGVEPKQYNVVLRRTREQMFGFLRGNGIQPPHRQQH